MPDGMHHEATALEEPEAYAAPEDNAALYQAVRRKYDRYFSVTHDQLGLASTAQTAPVKQWIDSIAPSNTSELLEADKWFRLDYSKKMDAALNLYHHEFLPPLQRALTAGVISKQSFAEWVSWVQDKGRDYKEKESSIRSTLPTYLETRYKLDRKRNSLKTSANFAALENSTDPKLVALAAKVTDDDHFLNVLSLSEREKAITEATAALPVAKEELAIFAEFMTELDGAVKSELISAGSKKKWIARFKDPSVSSKAKVYFVKSQFPSYKEAWKKVAADYKTLSKDETLKDITEKELQDIKKFTDHGTFLALHYDRKLSLMAEVRSAITAHKEGKRVLHDETKAILVTAATAGYISSNKVGPWLEHVMDGSRSLAELKTFIKDWAKVRYRFDNIEMTMTEGKVPQGLQRLSLEAFLNLNYAQRLSYVNEAERRLHIEKSPPSDTKLQDAKGKVRHALDTENWDEAKYYLGIAWSLAEEDSDIREIQSMEKYMQSFGQKSKADDAEENKQKAIIDANNEIATVLSLLPASLQPVYRKALAKGPACLQCVTTCVYNRTWCEERGYLNGAMEEELREKSIEETANRLRAGGEGHDDGLENNFVDGFHQPAIRNSGVGPQNLFLSTSGADAFVEKADANKNTFTFWYWTNLVVDGVSSAQNSYVSYALNHRIKRAARKLESLGTRYDPLLAFTNN